MTNPCHGPSALPANSSVPSLSALMSSRLSAISENLPGHAARLHLGDLVTISSPWGFPPPQHGGLGKWGEMERVKAKSPAVQCPALSLFGVQGMEKRGLPFPWRCNWLYWAILGPSAGRAVVTLHISRGSPGLCRAWGWVSLQGVGTEMGTLPWEMEAFLLSLPKVLLFLPR